MSNVPYLVHHIYLCGKVDSSVTDRRERRQSVPPTGVTQTMILEYIAELALFAVQRHVIQKHHIDEQVDVIRGR